MTAAKCFIVLGPQQPMKLFFGALKKLNWADVIKLLAAVFYEFVK
jgi:hypothetical protein